MYFGLVGVIGLALGQMEGYQTVALANEGESRYAIVKSASATPTEVFAAEELTAYLTRMSSASLPLESGSAGEFDEQIILCREGTREAAAMKPALEPLPPGGFAVSIRGPRIYLVGTDDRAVLLAAYALLERLGCRWLSPAFGFYGGGHELVPATAQLTLVQQQDVIYKPVLKWRKLYVEEGHSHNAENLRQLAAWMPKLRFNTLVIPIDYQGGGRVRWDNWREALTPELKKRGIWIEVGGHGYQNFLNAKMDEGRLFPEHPDWFGMDESGERTPQPGRVICTSNPQAVAYLQGNVVKYLKARPEIEVFDFWPPDGAKWCTCAACQALGSPSERHARMVSQMAEVLAKELPNVRLECIAYSSYLEPPKKTPIHESVLVDFCPIRQCFESQIYESGSKANQEYASALREWRSVFKGEISIYSYYRKYAWDSLPIVIPHYMQNDLRFYRDRGVQGVSSYAEPGDWFTYELNHYVLARLAWNPDIEVDAVLGSFCGTRYGPSSIIAQTALATLEEVARHACSIPGTTLKTPDEYDKFLEKISAAVKPVSASAKAHEREPLLAGNLRRLGLMLEYASRDITIRRQQAAKGPAAERRAMVDSLVKFLQEHKDEGVFVWHRRLEAEGQYKKYGIEK